METIYDIIIIGGGPAGYSAALYAARAGYNTLVIEKMGAGGQMALTGDIDNYPGFDEGIDGFLLGQKMQKGAERFGAKTKYAEVRSCELNGPVKKINLRKETLFTKAVIIATGASPRKLGIEREDELVGMGVHYCAHCDGRFYEGKTVAVVGGGNSAVSDALYLSRLAEKVYLIHRRETLCATKIYHEPLQNTPNIQFVWNSVVENFVVDKRLSAIKLSNIKNGEKQILDVDGLFVSIGRDPFSQIFEGQLPLDNNGYIIADESTQTAIDGVFAIGDVRTKAFRQVVTAVADGATAVHFAERYLQQ